MYRVPVLWKKHPTKHTKPLLSTTTAKKVFRETGPGLAFLDNALSFLLLLPLYAHLIFVLFWPAGK